MITIRLFLYELFSAFSFYFACINPQYKSVKKGRQIIILAFILVCTFIFAPAFGQLVTPFAILVVSILLIYKQENIYLKLICFYLGYLLLVLLDYSFTNLIFLLFHITISELQHKYLLLFSAIYLLILFILTKLLGWFLHRKLKISTYFSLPKFAISLCINLIVCVAIFILGIIYGEKVGYPPRIVLFNGILFFIYFLLSNLTFLMAYRTLKKDEQLNTQLQQYENLASYTQEVERLYLNMRAFKHDYLDILSSMKEFIDNKNMQELDSYFYENILPLNKQMVESDNRLGALSYLNDNAVKSIISAKLMIAIEMGINVELELREEIDIPVIKRIDLVRILGIFLNNAIDASVTSDDKEITIAFFRNEEKCTILIRNTTPPLTLPVSVLCHKQTTTKEGHSGIGLDTAQNILNRYKNIHWKLNYKAPYFLTEIIITIQNQ